MRPMWVKEEKASDCEMVIVIVSGESCPLGSV
jgi:hypothetical protein